MTSDRLLTMIGLAGLAFCGGATASLGAKGQPSADNSCAAVWRAKVQPIADSYCVACHQTASPAGGLSLQRGDAPASLLGVQSNETKLARVEPGDLGRSYLFLKIMGTHETAGGSGDRMPLGGALSVADIAVFENWIATCRLSRSQGS